MTPYRLGLKMNTSSIGWCALNLNSNGDPTGIRDMGVRVFHDGRNPKTGESSAVQRTSARSMRRRLERLVMRRRNVEAKLVKFGLMPQDKTQQQEILKLNPLQLRNDALQRELSPYEVGCALLHLQQRRGFKSNRKDAQKGGNDVTPLKEAARDLAQDLEARNQTLGQFLYARNLKAENTHVRPRANGSKLIYDYYPTRIMVEDEFMRIWESQENYHPLLLTEEARKILHHAIFFQRPLKPQEKGRCSIVATDTRLPWAMPSAQAFRMIKEVNNLKIHSIDDHLYEGKELKERQELTVEQKQKVFNKLCTKGSMNFNAIRKLLGLNSAHTFNLESKIRDKLLGDKTAEVMRKENNFGGAWDTLTRVQQDTIVEMLLSDKEDEEVIEFLTNNYQLTPTQTENILLAFLPAGCVNFGATVISSILPKMIEEGVTEPEAISNNPNWQNHWSIPDKKYNKLPYYGEVLPQHVRIMESSGDPMIKKYGSVSNVTVHIALNQLRRLINRLKKQYGGWPQEIVIETGRDLAKGRAEIKDIISKIEKHTKQKEQWRIDIAELKSIPVEEVSTHDIRKMKLWKEMGGNGVGNPICIYTGESISITKLLSNDIDIGHILPYSRTIDDTAANKILVPRWITREKGRNTPFEFIQNPVHGINHNDVWARAQILPESKRWRFLPNAMDIFESKESAIIAKSGTLPNQYISTEIDVFGARALNDTRYIAKLIRKYLKYGCANGNRGLVATPGVLTGMLRNAWGFNNILGDREKDHRSHAVDAFIVAMTTRQMVKIVSRIAAKAEESGINLRNIIPKPWSEFEWNGFKNQLESIVVSYKSDHGKEGCLHEATCYGYIEESEEEGKAKLVIREPISKFTKVSDIGKIRDNALREALEKYIIGKSDIQQALRDFKNDNIQWSKMNSVRVVIEKNRNVMISPSKEPYKWMQGGNNHRAEIYCPRSGKKEGKWQIEVIKTFDANRSDFIPAWKSAHPDAERIMILHANDIVRYYDADRDCVEIRRVKKLSGAGIVHLTPLNIAAEDADENSWGASARQLQIKNAERIFVRTEGTIYSQKNKRGINE